MKIIQATMANIDELVPLFDGYRQFYQQDSDCARACEFLTQRIEQGESVVFLAFDDSDTAVGFTQLYPTFSSIRMVQQWILNDLFVAESARGKGVANALLETAELFAQQSGAQGLSLSTAIDNNSAQALYEKRGWVKDTGFFHYSKSVV